MKLEIVCFANSRKLKGRCIAGLRTDGGGWVRPVAPTQHGQLYPPHYRLEDGSEPRLLDVLAIHVRGHRPEPHQPENWLIENEPWTRVRRPTPAELASLVHSNLHDRSPLFGTSDDRVPITRFERQPADYSLALVVAEAVTWSVGSGFSGDLQARARFEWGGITYDLAVTDPDLEARLRHLDVGAHSSVAAGFPAGDRIFLTISLGEPLADGPAQGACFKLVAAAIPESLLQGG